MCHLTTSTTACNHHMKSSMPAIKRLLGLSYFFSSFCSSFFSSFFGYLRFFFSFSFSLSSFFFSAFSIFSFSATAFNSLGCNNLYWLIRTSTPKSSRNFSSVSSSNLSAIVLANFTKSSSFRKMISAALNCWFAGLRPEKRSSIARSSLRRESSSALRFSSAVSARGFSVTVLTPSSSLVALLFLSFGSFLLADPARDYMGFALSSASGSFASSAGLFFFYAGLSLSSSTISIQLSATSSSLISTLSKYQL